MDISVFEATVYGFVSGLTEFLPVSAQAHQLILRSIFGIAEVDHLLNLFVRLGMIAGLLLTTGSYIKHSFREYKFSKSFRRRRKREVNQQAAGDINFVKIACIPVLLSFLLYSKTQSWGNMIPVVSLLLLVNGIILLIPIYLSRGNKDSRNMNTLDSVMFGIVSGISMLPGVSRIGIGSSFAIARGADPNHAYNWCLILSVPVLLILSCFDLVSVFAVGVTGFGALYVLKCILSCAFSFIASCLAITAAKALSLRNSISGFAYYSIGAALFAFILYLY